MRVVETVRGMRAARAEMDEPVSMMATLGGMHRGHEELLSRAREFGATLVASLFLNPTQFDDPTDLERYPADRPRDLEILRAHGVDIAFTPSTAEMYPSGDATLIDPGPLGFVLEGAHRPGHFAGVATVVGKLLALIRPDIAVWGAKDAQQNLIIRRVSHELGMDVDHRIVSTVRHDDGLALSSRNARLSPSERAAAPVLYQALSDAARRFAGGETESSALVAGIRELIDREPLVGLEYVSVADPHTLEERPQAQAGDLLSLAAVLGATRLIDNVVLPNVRSVDRGA